MTNTFFITLRSAKKQSSLAFCSNREFINSPHPQSEKHNISFVGAEEDHNGFIEDFSLFPHKKQEKYRLIR